MKIYLDVESAGIKGKLLSVQYSIERANPVFIRVSKEEEKMNWFYQNILMDEKNILIGYNIGFDLWKLYQHYKPAKPFKCYVIDLYLSVLTRPPFCYYNIAGGKAVARLTKIPKYLASRVGEKVIFELKKIIPNFISIKIKQSEVKENKGLVSLQFIPKCSNKLKSLMANIFGEKTIETKDAFILPAAYRMQENTRIPTIQKEEEKFYEFLANENEKMLDSEKGQNAILYALNDIKYLFILEDFLNKFSAPASEKDENNICTHAVAYTKFVGFTVDMLAVKENILRLKKEEEEIKKVIKINLQSSLERKQLLQEIIGFPVIYTGKKYLELYLTMEIPESAKDIIKKMLRYKPIQQRINQLESVEKSDGRVYPDFRIFGTSSGRMAGCGGFNFQGISREGEIRKCVKTSMGGDFSNLEVNIAAQIFEDENLEKDLAAGLDLHTKTATLINQQLKELGYAACMEIKENKKHPLYSFFKKIREKAKSINFAILYFCEMGKVAEILDLPPLEAEKLMEEEFFKHYAGLKKAREFFKKKYCTADFDKWTKESVGKMDDSIQDIFGNKRYIKFEKAVAKLFWEKSDMFAEILTEEEKEKYIIRQKMKGKQKTIQALRSACLGAASSIQKSVMRSLGNFPNQSSGSRLTKKLMARIFELGIPSMNVHDELVIPESYESDFPRVLELVNDFLREYQEYVPTLYMQFERMGSWADKG